MKTNFNQKLLNFTISNTILVLERLANSDFFFDADGKWTSFLSERLNCILLDSCCLIRDIKPNLTNSYEKAKEYFHKKAKEIYEYSSKFESYFYDYFKKGNSKETDLLSQIAICYLSARGILGDLDNKLQATISIKI